MSNRQFCKITSTLVDGQAIPPNHWHAPPHTGNSTKSLVVQAILPNHWQAPPQQTILPNHWHTPPQPQTILPNHWHRQFSQITGKLLHIQAILPNHWHTPPQTYNSTKSLAHSTKYMQFCKITGTGNKSVKSLAHSSTYR